MDEIRDTRKLMTDELREVTRDEVIQHDGTSHHRKHFILNIAQYCIAQYFCVGEILMIVTNLYFCKYNVCRN